MSCSHADRIRFICRFARQKHNNRTKVPHSVFPRGQRIRGESTRKSAHGCTVGYHIQHSLDTRSAGIEHFYDCSRRACNVVVLAHAVVARPLSPVHPSQQHLHPARARQHKLSRVAGAPTLGEADPDRVRIVRAVRELWVTDLREHFRRLVVENFHAVTGQNLVHDERPRVRDVERRRVNKQRVLRPVIHPHPVRFLTERHPVTDLRSGP